MVELIRERVCVEVEGEVVVFLIGMRINKFWKVWQWLRVTRAMGAMLAELKADPALGLLATRGQFGLRNLWLLQYWRSAAHLQDFAHAGTHRAAWRAFNRAVGTNGDVGIWHETYVVPPGHAETIYANMPRFGLGLAGELHPAQRGRNSAAQRLRLAASASVTGSAAAVSSEV